MIVELQGMVAERIRDANRDLAVQQISQRATDDVIAPASCQEKEKVSGLFSLEKSPDTNGTVVM